MIWLGAQFWICGTCRVIYVETERPYVAERAA